MKLLLEVLMKEVEQMVVKVLRRMGNIEDTDQGCSDSQEDEMRVSEALQGHHLLTPGISHWNVVVDQLTEAIQGIPAMCYHHKLAPTDVWLVGHPVL